MNQILPPDGDKASKTRRVEKPEQATKSKADLMEQIMKLLTKLVLKNSLEIRELQACTLKVFLVQKAGPYAAAVKEGYDNFAEKYEAAQAGEEKEKLISPSVAAWIGLVRAAIDQEGIPEVAKQNLIKHRDGTNFEELVEGVRLVKTRKAWDKNTLKLLVCVAPEMAGYVQSFATAVVASGGKLKRGVAPRGGLENDLQELLDTLEAYK